MNLEPRTRKAELRVTFAPRGREGPTEVVRLGPLHLTHHADWPWGQQPTLLHMDDIEQWHTFHCAVPNVRLWWPWDLGAPNLHDVDVELWLDQEFCDHVGTTFGVRTVQKGLNDPIADRWNWALLVNGVRFFARGSCYLSDQFPSRMTGQRYKADVQLAKDGNINMLRVFATVEKPEFYDICDQLGIWVYQDYPLQWGGYVHTDEFSRACQRQAAGLVHLMHNHPSVFMYAGHSEPFDVEVQREIDRPMTTVVRAHDPTRPVIFENGTGPERDLHAWGCGWYGGQVDDIDAWCAAAQAGFVGEFGAQSFPSMDQLLRYPTLTEEDLKVPINIAKLELLNLQLQPCERYLGLEPGRDPIGVWIERSQAYQAELIKTHIEAFRRHKYRDINGALAFHFVDNYPGISWSIVDFWRSPKPAYFALQKAFQPIHVMASRGRCQESDPGHSLVREVWVVNDSRQAYPGCQVRWWFTDPRGHEIGKGILNADVREDDLILFGQVGAQLSEGFLVGRYLLALELCDDQKVLLSNNEYEVEVNLALTQGYIP